MLAALATIPIADYCARAGVAEADVRAVARRIARAASVSIFEDLGIQQAPHSTLNSYLEKLLYLLTGNFGKRGGMNLHTHFGALVGEGKRDRRTPVGGHRIITGLIPCNVIPDEILTDHPKRFRALLVESANPAHSLADSQRMREALAALDLVVVIDVAMTETARLADYVLPAASQFEKWEATFFTLEFPKNVFQLRAPLLAPLAGHAARARDPPRGSCARSARSTTRTSRRCARPPREGRAAFAAAFFGAAAKNPQLAALAPVVLYETLGPTLPDGAAAAAPLLRPRAPVRAGVPGVAAPRRLRRRESARAGRRAVRRDPARALGRGVHRRRARGDLAAARDGRRAHPPRGAGAARPSSPRSRDEEPSLRDPAFPFVLSAGERRTTTANTIFRDPAWRKKDGDGALRMNPTDAARLGVADGGRVRVTTKRGSVETVVEITDTLQPGHVTLPNGLGLDYPDENGRTAMHGVAPNELTASEDRDWLAGTPWHKHVRARVEAIA